MQLVDPHLRHHHVDGRAFPAVGRGRITLTDPTTEKAFGSAPAGDAVDVDAAVGAAHRALHDPTWAGSDAATRARWLRRLADALEARADDLAPLITHQNGMPVKMVRWGNVFGAGAAYRYYADVIEGLVLEDWREARPAPALVRRTPVGVVGIIAPWNGPQILVAWKLAPALAAGCTVVLKPAPETSLDAHVLADAVLEAGFPPGVVNVVTGGRETGEALVEHPLVDKIAFTGSSAAGRAIAAKAGAALKPVTLELGGKSAAILLDDADTTAFARQVTRLCAPNSGQVCYSCTRVIAPAHRYDEVVDAVIEGMRAARVGDPQDEATNMGPLVSARQRDRVEEYIAIGRDEGADLVLGGGREPSMDNGYFIAPTVFRHVDPAMRVAREEIFGPVLVVLRARDDDDAVRIANDSDYGLGGAVFTSDPERGLAIARRIETGTIGINGYDLTMAAPFGGTKASGMGRELGPEGIDPYLWYQSVYNAPEPRVHA